MRFRLIAFDLVGTLTEKDALYRRIHKVMDCEEKAKKNVLKYLEERITEKELIETNVSYHKGISKKRMLELVKRLEFRNDVNKLIKNLKKLKYKIALITSDYDIAAQYVKKKFNFDYAFGCKEVFENNKLIRCSEIVDGKTKLNKIEFIAKKEKINLSKVVYVGNDSNDIHIFNELKKNNGCSIALYAADKIRELASFSFDKPIIELVELIKEIEKYGVD